MLKSELSEVKSQFDTIMKEVGEGRRNKWRKKWRENIEKPSDTV